LVVWQDCLTSSDARSSKGRDTKDNVARNFGMASPGGYRKAMRLMEHANRFGMPILTFIDTPELRLVLKQSIRVKGRSLTSPRCSGWMFQLSVR